PVVYVSMHPNGDIEVHLVIRGVRVCLPDVPRDPARPQHRSAYGVGHRLLRSKNPDTPRALYDDLVLQQYVLVLVQLLGQLLDKLPSGWHELRWNISRHA